MTKVLWHSVAPWCPTGYGGQTALFAPRIAARDDIDLAISSGFGLNGYSIRWNGIHVYPGDDWNRTALQWALHHGQGEPVTVITLMDVWPLDIELFKAIEQQGTLACWVPVDHQPVPPVVLNFLTQTRARPIAMSKFGEQQLRDAGLDPLYVPHAVDTAMYQPHDRDEIRRLMSFDADAFVVGVVANNQGQSPPRKAFSESFLAFAEFRGKHPNAVMYLHAEVSGFRNGLDLTRLAERFEIPHDAIRVTDQVIMENGIPAGVMAGFYSAFDVLLNPSYGEGFGVPLIEAQACGTPVIVTDWTSMPELCGAGWTVGGTLWDHPMMESFWLAPDPVQIVDALEKAHEARGDMALRAQAREFALAYDVDRVMDEHWVPVLEALGKAREVPPLPNRQLRRAAKRKAAVA